MNWSGAFHRLDLHDPPGFEDEIGSESLVEDDVAITDRDRNLTLNLEAPFAEFVRQCGFVDGLEQTGAEHPMDGECCVDDFFGDVVLGHSRLCELCAFA